MTQIKNRARNFGIMLRYLARAVDAAPAGLDVDLVVVDFASTDTDVRGCLTAIPVPSTYVRLDDEYSRPRGRNAAARAAEGDRLFFVDADMVVPRNFFEYAAAWTRPGWACFPICTNAGHGYNPLEDPERQCCDQSRLGIQRRYGFGNCGFSQEDYEKIAPWNEKKKWWGKEDDEMYDRARAVLEIRRDVLHGLVHLDHPRDGAFLNQYCAPSPEESEVTNG